jgi:hypothetical protein
MKIHKFEVYVIDQEEYGAESYQTEIEQLDTGNALFQVRDIKTIDIDGDDFDEHPLNNLDTPLNVIRDLFED